MPSKSNHNLITTQGWDKIIWHHFLSIRGLVPENFRSTILRTVKVILKIQQESFHRKHKRLLQDTPHKTKEQLEYINSFKIPEGATTYHGRQGKVQQSLPLESLDPRYKTKKLGPSSGRGGEHNCHRAAPCQRVSEQLVSSDSAAAPFRLLWQWQLKETNHPCAAWHGLTPPVIQVSPVLLKHSADPAQGQRQNSQVTLEQDETTHNDFGVCLHSEAKGNYYFFLIGDASLSPKQWVKEKKKEKDWNIVWIIH